MIRKRSQSYKNFSEHDPNTYVQCAICLQKMLNLTQHVKHKHGFTGYSYLAIYGGTLRSKLAAKDHANSLKQYLALPGMRERYRQIQLKQYANTPKEIIKQKHGNPKESHPQWGKHMIGDSLRKNKESNRKTHLKQKQELINQGKWDAYRKGCINKREPVMNPHKVYVYKRVPHTSKISGKTFLLHGSYEYRMALIFDTLKCNWEKTKDTFPYIWNNEQHMYTPDFKVVKKSGAIFYYETKGWLKERDILKHEMMVAKGFNFILVREKKLRAYERHLGL